MPLKQSLNSLELPASGYGRSGFLFFRLQSRSTHCTFLFDYLELEPHGYEFRDALIYSLSGFMDFAVNPEVVGISDEFVAPTFQFPIQLPKGRLTEPLLKWAMRVSNPFMLNRC
jgi:hypothetical protein